MYLNKPYDEIIETINKYHSVYPGTVIDPSKDESDALRYKACTFYDFVNVGLEYGYLSIVLPNHCDDPHTGTMLEVRNFMPMLEKTSGILSFQSNPNEYHAVYYDSERKMIYDPVGHRYSLNYLLHIKMNQNKRKLLELWSFKK